MTGILCCVRLIQALLCWILDQCRITGSAGLCCLNVKRYETHQTKDWKVYKHTILNIRLIRQV